MAIDKKLQEYYENRFMMMSEQGWKDLMEDIDERIDAIQSIDGVKDIEMLYKRQGELDTLKWLKSLSELSERVYKQLLEE